MAESPPLVATYRVQLTPTFGLDDAAQLVPYLARLGISHVYTSSYLTAATGSTHGYDTVDHSTVSRELGGEQALLRFHAALRDHGMGNVVDVVPNHVSVADAATNQRWWNVLRNGPTSADARFFDVDWDAHESRLHGRILVPVLGGDYADELASGAITLVTDPSSGEREIHYGDLRFPVAPTTVVDDDQGEVDETHSDIHAVLEQQHYRLACWRVARDELNYRRFFDVTTLAGVRVEDADVFTTVHERTLGWVRSGDVQGLRIDHPDGLRDPAGYLVDLRAAAPDAWITIEKILEPGETLPTSWPVDGTTGYDVMRRMTGVYVDPAAEAAMTAIFESFVDDDQPYADRVIDCKRLVLRDLLGTEVSRLTELAVQGCQTSVDTRDFSRHDVRLAVEAMLAAMPVYRTYVTGSSANSSAVVSDADAVILEQLVIDAARIEPDVDASLLQFLGRMLTGDPGDTNGLEFVARFQQLSGPAMAKGVEDTVFYRYPRLLALNEVGADPSEFGMTIAQFHAESERTAAAQPRTMSSTSTHDTKRSEDVRSRIALLSEVPGEWAEQVQRWRARNDPKWAGANPDRTMEYLLYQTLVGAHPIPTDRLRTVLEKSMREAKQVTSWLHPTAAEDVLHTFSDALEADPHFQAELDAWITRFRPAARVGALGQLVLKALGPGIPDFYQGSELWTSSLVDPDNRAAVDYATRTLLLDDLDRASDPPPLDADDVGATKLWLTRRLLQIRRSAVDAFTGPNASYLPLSLTGSLSATTLGFCRGERVVAVVAVRPVALDRDGWGDTTLTLPRGDWHDALAGTFVGTGRGGGGGGAGTSCNGVVLVSRIAGPCGVAVLVRSDTIVGGVG